jgi:hypothetical protein
VVGVVEFGATASPIGKAPAVLAAVVGLFILVGVVSTAVAQTPDGSRLHRIPALCWFALVGCTATGLLGIAVRTGLFVPGGTGILLASFLFLALKARRDG